MVIAIPSFALGQGVARDAPWGCDAGAIALCHQGDPPHPKPGSCHCNLALADRPLSRQLTVSRFSSQTRTTKPSWPYSRPSPEWRTRLRINPSGHTPCRFGAWDLRGTYEILRAERPARGGDRADKASIETDRYPGVGSQPGRQPRRV